MFDPSTTLIELPPGNEHLNEGDRLARHLALPDSWTEVVEGWEADAQARGQRAQGERKPN